LENLYEKKRGVQNRNVAAAGACVGRWEPRKKKDTRKSRQKKTQIPEKKMGNEWEVPREQARKKYDISPKKTLKRASQKLPEGVGRKNGKEVGGEAARRK